MSKWKHKDYVKAAAVAHTDLNIFGAVVALMEHSLLSSACFTAEARIVAVCKQESARCLDRYDAAIAMAETFTKKDPRHAD